MKTIVIRTVIIGIVNYEKLFFARHPKSRDSGTSS